MAAPRHRVVVEVLVALAGGALVALAWRLDTVWFERYFALDARRAYFATMWRLVLAVAGVSLALLVRPRAGAWATRVGPAEGAAACARMALSLALSLVASEIGLRVLGLPRRYDMAVTSVSLGEKSARYGWLFKASQSFTIDTAGRPTRYDFDAGHDRARSTDAAPDPTLPTLLFAGESITAGHGLAWEESYPALVGEALGLQVVDLGVDGYASDQAFLRLADALPRFERPVAVVTFFMPGLVDRVQRVDHPRVVFDGALPRLVPPGFVESTRLAQAFREVLGYRAEWAIQETASVLRETARLAKARGARAVFVAPYLGPDWPRGDGYLVGELLRREGLTVVDPRFGFEPIPGDNHPNAPSTRRLAEAITLALQTELGAHVSR